MGGHLQVVFRQIALNFNTTECLSGGVHVWARSVHVRGGKWFWIQIGEESRNTAGRALRLGRALDDDQVLALGLGGR